jgi:hypothetical protein
MCDIQVAYIQADAAIASRAGVADSVDVWAGIGDSIRETFAQKDDELTDEELDSMVI